MQYKVTMWNKSEYRPSDCPLDIEADSEYKAAVKAMQYYTGSRLRYADVPMIYEIKEADKV